MITEYAVPEIDKQSMRNYAFAPLAVIGGGVAAWNIGQAQ